MWFYSPGQFSRAYRSKANKPFNFFIDKFKDGYPREVAQGIQFESEINPCALVIYFEVSDDVMTARLMNRGEKFLKKFTKDELNFRLNVGKGLTSGRVDDNEETIRKRLDTFHKHSLPVVEHYGTKCRTVNDLSQKKQKEIRSPLKISFNHIGLSLI